MGAPSTRTTFQELSRRKKELKEQLQSLLVKALDSTKISVIASGEKFVHHKDANAEEVRERSVSK